MSRFFCLSKIQLTTGALDYDNLTTSAATAASYTTTLTGANNDIVYTADVPGSAGNGISIRYRDPGAATQALSVSVSGQAITVNLATDAGSVITSTGSLVLAAVNAHVDAGPLVTAALSGADTGAGVVTAMNAQFLTGGNDADKTVPNAVSGATAGGNYWPVTGGNVDRNIQRIDRNDEVRALRVPTPPLPFRANPTLTVPVPAYLDIIRQVIPRVMGSVEATTTPAPGTTSGVTQHRYVVPAATITTLPWMYVQLVRDDLDDRMSGGYVNRVTFNFPIDGEGTMECEFLGTYLRHYVNPNTQTATYAATLSDVLMLRDASLFINNSGSTVSDLQALSITYSNNAIPKWYAGRNRVKKTFYDPAGLTGNEDQQKKLWWPAENKLTGQLDITYSLTFGNTTAAQEIITDWTVIQKFQFDIAGNTISGAVPATTEELLRFTIPGGAATGGGAGDLTARDEIVTTLDGQASDLTVDIWDSSAVALTTTW